MRNILQAILEYVRECKRSSVNAARSLSTLPTMPYSTKQFDTHFSSTILPSIRQSHSPGNHGTSKIGPILDKKDDGHELDDEQGLLPQSQA